MGHIQLARWADAVVLAPTTANLLTKLARGIAEDLLTTLVLAADVPVLLAPAMNVSMWQSDATQANVEMLKKRGFSVLEPVSGELACGEQGAGRLAEPESIVQAALPLLIEQILQGQTWVINAGPTIESWDAVRTMSNRASGALGAFLADAAAIRGADVTLIAGKGTPPTRDDVQRFDVESVADMYAACLTHAKDSDVFVGTAAVSDYRFADTASGKLKRGQGALSVKLIENPDIIAAVASMAKRPSKVIAFAAESEHHIAHAQDKLARKAVDAVVANDVSNMGSDSASGWWVSKDDIVVLESQSKQQFAASLIPFISALSK
jgi:phosphopantothenoylcysteine decarboxylase/phosphopantothenate--cysteine ligase